MTYEIVMEKVEVMEKTLEKQKNDLNDLTMLLVDITKYEDGQEEIMNITEITESEEITTQMMTIIKDMKKLRGQLDNQFDILRKSAN
jgi:hypothetical protein